jgi:sugar phosphate isomerase/epimerase
MTRTLSLAHLSVLDLSPPQVVATAAAAGFDAVGLRLMPARDGEAAHPVIGDTPMRRETLARLTDTGVCVLDIEVIWLRPDTKAAAFEPMFESGARLGARRVLAVCGDPDEVRAAATLAQLCELARPFEPSIDVEFIRWTEMKTLDAALRILDMAACPNSGVLVDCLHAVRAGVTPAAVAAIDRHRVGYFQLCDAPATAPASGDLAHEARFDRLPPGEGRLPLAEFVRALPPDTPASVEVPMSGRWGMLPTLEGAQMLRAAARRVLAATDFERSEPDA